MFLALEYSSDFPFPVLSALTTVCTLTVSWESCVRSLQAMAFPLPRPAAAATATAASAFSGRAPSAGQAPAPSGEPRPLRAGLCLHLGKFSASLPLVNISFSALPGVPYRALGVNSTVKGAVTVFLPSMCPPIPAPPRCPVVSFSLSPLDCELIGSRDFYSISVHRARDTVKTECKSVKTKTEKIPGKRWDQRN